MVSTLFTAFALIAAGQAQVPPAPPAIVTRSGQARARDEKPADRPD